MPGLLGETFHDGADQAIEASMAPLESPTPPEPTEVHPPAGELGRLDRLEDAVRRLDDERSRLASEVGALRLEVEGLREVVLPLDERDSVPPSASPTRSIEPLRRDPDEVQNARTQRLPPVPVASMAEEVAIKPPAGPVELEVRVLSVDDPAVLEYLQRALSTLPDLDGVQVIQCGDDEATLRCSLTRPQPERELFDAIQSALPSAKPLAGAEQGKLLLRMRPV